MPKFNEPHLKKLKRCKDAIEAKHDDDIFDQLWMGTSARGWLEKVNPEFLLANVPEKPLSRQELLNHIQDIKNQPSVTDSDIDALIIAVFAWGGMRQTKLIAGNAVKTMPYYRAICRKLIEGYDPEKAYQQFYALHLSGKMKGIGPAFYTKMIFFLGDQTGLIMDQWTSRSANLLLGKNIIKLSNGVVAKNNSRENYSCYLEFMDNLKNELGCKSSATAEQLIFSCSHKKNDLLGGLRGQHSIFSAWRKYVVENT